MTKTVGTALITGSLGGIGQALCHAFREAGYRVIGSDRGAGKPDTDVFVQFDICRVAREDEYRAQILKRLRTTIGPEGLKVLINNAAVQRINPTEKITVEELHETLDTNLIGPFLLVQGLLPELERALGSVINIGSVHATNTKPGFVSYATSKAALVGLTRSLAVDLGRVNAINPAATATPMLMAGFKGKEEAFRHLEAMHPLERIAEPAEIADVAVFLASEQASFMTGAALAVDGGIGGRLHDPA
jgi:NAD(P)-dependent dehydrogenase (short-subunit alcohol dehydrogenase family)